MQRQFSLDQQIAAGGNSNGTASHQSMLDRVVQRVPAAVQPGAVPFHMLSLSSQYQPILNVGARRIEGYEGLIRGHNVAGQALPPDTLFNLAHDLGESQYLDLLARALHIRNAAAVRVSASMPLLFINVYPEAAGADLHDETLFANLMRHYNVDPSQLVIEILETGVDDEARLKDAVQLYRRLGCKVALDDFGVGYSNFDRLWRLEPDIVKIDRSVMRSAAQDPSARRVLTNMVHMIHECGAAAVIEGVEERADALIALETDADFLQGFYFSRPASTAMDDSVASNMLESLLHELDQGTALNRSAAAPALREYAWLVENMAEAMERGASFPLACEALLQDPLALRASLYSLEGRQLASSLNLKRVSAAEAQCWRCPSGRGWQLPQLLRATVSQPGLLRVTRPLEAHALDEECVTLSYGFNLNEEMVVLCVDVRCTEVRLDDVALAD